MNDKSFKCVDFKHAAQMRIYKDIKNLAPERELECFRRRLNRVFSDNGGKSLRGSPSLWEGMARGKALGAVELVRLVELV